MTKKNKCVFGLVCVGLQVVLYYHEGLARHRRTHIEKRLFKCDFDRCDAAFGLLKNLARHRKTHTDEASIIGKEQ